MVQFLGPSDVRELAGRLDVHPSKRWGQNFVVDAGTVRRIARKSEVSAADHVLEVGPGLGSLTLALLETGARVTAIEIDPRLAAELPRTIGARASEQIDALRVIQADAMEVGSASVDEAWGGAVGPPTALVANLPYNVSVPVILHALSSFIEASRALVMVQAEVADRLVAPPGSRTYGIPSAKVAWYASARSAGGVGRAAFWPVPRVDSSLVLLERREPPATGATREETFAAIDAAFAHRRKALRAAVRDLVGTTEAAEAVLSASGIDPLARGETLGIGEFARLAETLSDFRRAL